MLKLVIYVHLSYAVACEQQRLELRIINIFMKQQQQTQTTVWERERSVYKTSFIAVVLLRLQIFTSRDLWGCGIFERQITKAGACMISCLASFALPRINYANANAVCLFGLPGETQIGSSGFRDSLWILLQRSETKGWNKAWKPRTSGIIITLGGRKGKWQEGYGLLKVIYRQLWILRDTGSEVQLRHLLMLVALL